MGWTVYLEKNGRRLEAPTRAKGGTYNLIGVPQTELSVTYNYSDIIKDATGWSDSLRRLHGKTAKSTISDLRAAVQLLGTDQSVDYWEATRGNVGHMFSVLLDWAQQYPNAKWVVH